MADFASMLKYLREREGLSQRELSKKIGISASAIGMYESGSRHPDFETEETIADFFNVDLNTLRGRVITEHPIDLTSDEQLLVETYRTASDDIKGAIRAILASVKGTK